VALEFAIELEFRKLMLIFEEGGKPEKNTRRKTPGTRT